MAHGGILRAPYRAAQELLVWASNNWIFIDGKSLLGGCDLETLDANRFLHVIAQLLVEDQLFEHAEDRDKARAAVRRKFMDYSSTESYGRSNDDLGGMSQAPLPYVPPTEFSDQGYAGLDPPLG